MALALIVLAVGSVVAGYVGLPRVLGGSNRFEQFLEPSFARATPAPIGEPAARATALELTLMVRVDRSSRSAGSASRCFSS